jgi:tetratricopeptide (TPR) repeat protein
MNIDPDIWPKLSLLMSQWIEIPAPRRAEWIENLGLEYVDVLPALRQLLASESAGNAFGTLAKFTIRHEFTGTHDPLSVGDRLGPWRILSEIGHGGMGTVYRAERDDGRFAQRVAIKVISGGLNTPDFVERFQREYRILASLEHPNVARLLDAGATEDGRPYFVMEYVEGCSIDQFCAKHNFTIRQKLRLMLPIFDAVRFAHQKLIVHRDLKPDNILVTNEGVPKLLDFGIARVLIDDPGVNQATLMAMTPEYASPEQVRGEPVGTGTDVYSLGCVLYKLLTGAAPHGLRGKSPAECVRSICEEEPPSASRLNQEIGRDEVTILRMAMRKEAPLRYRSVEQFGADIDRFLAHEPVLARPASAGYHLRKYIWRHKAGVAMGSALVLLLIGFTTFQFVQLRRITRERERADRVTQFMSGMFRVPDPGEARGNSVTAREILDKAAIDIDSGLSSDPQLKAQMMAVMGEVYGNLGLYVRAQSLLEHSLDMRRGMFGPGDAQVLSSTDDLVLNLKRAGHFTDAEKRERQALEERQRVLGTAQRPTLNSMSGLANTLMLEGRYAAAEKLGREALEKQRRALPANDPDTIRSLSNLANTLQREGSYAEAEKVQLEVLESERRIHGSEDPETAVALGNLAATLSQEGRYAEAEKLQQETLALRRRMLGPEHPDTLVAMTELATTIKRQARYADAERLERIALEIQRRVLGPEHPSTLTSMNNLATSLNHEGRYQEAEQLLRAAVEIKRRVLGKDHPETLRSMVNLATSMVEQKHYRDAEKLEREALDARRRLLGPVHPDVALSTYNLAVLKEREGQRDEAFRLLLDAVDHGLSPGNSRGIEKDTDLRSLRADARFAPLVLHAKERAAASLGNQGVK